MSDPLYRKELLRLAADAHGAGRLAAPDASGTLFNPACGDKVTIGLELQHHRITAIAHDTKACVLAQASASILGGALIATLLRVRSLFQLLGSQDLAEIALGQIGLATLLGIYGGAYPVALAEMFSPGIRCSAASFSLNLGMGILGGTTPLVAVFLVNQERFDMGPVYYLMAVVTLSLFGVITWRRAPEQRGV